MLVPVWTVASWKTVVASSRAFSRHAMHLTHLGTCVQPRTGSGGRRCGQVLWGTRTPEGMVGLAWDWAEVRDSVITLSDPMTIMSNVKLVDADGESLSESERILHMNNVVHELNWQGSLREARKSEALALAA